MHAQRRDLQRINVQMAVSPVDVRGCAVRTVMINHAGGVER